MNDLLFITFDIKKDEYPPIPYSIAVMMAALKNEGFKVGHFSIDIQHAMADELTERLEFNRDRINLSMIDLTSKLGFEITRKPLQNVLTNSVSGFTKFIRLKLAENVSYFQKFKYIAISLTSWSIEHCQNLLILLQEYSGKVILGGYEVTSMDDEMLLNLFPRADFFIKGYAEKALIQLLSGISIDQGKIIRLAIEDSNLVSPYLSGTIHPTTRKVHWETKRGCPHHCGFCEWGNSIKNVFEIDKERLFKEIHYFGESCIEEVNILDGTFNYGKNYLEIFKELLKIEDLKITCQARFEKLFDKTGTEFIQLCKQNRHRVHLEFGLQTIHKNEMEVIGRLNNMEKVKKALLMLYDLEIDYEVSIIYAIPGQTVESFIDTIEFLFEYGCGTIRAYQLSIPKNSKMYLSKSSLSVMESKSNFNVNKVISSYSSTKEEVEEMKRIAERLINGSINKNTIIRLKFNFVYDSM